MTYTNNTGSADILASSTSSTLRTAGTPCTLGDNDLAHFSPWTFRMTSIGGNGPGIVRTA